MQLQDFQGFPPRGVQHTLAPISGSGFGAFPVAQGNPYSSQWQDLSNPQALFEQGAGQYPVNLLHDTIIVAIAQQTITRASVVVFAGLGVFQNSRLPVAYMVENTDLALQQFPYNAGVAMDAAAVGQLVRVMVRGIFYPFDTSGGSAQQAWYVSSVAGQLSTAAPGSTVAGNAYLVGLSLDKRQDGRLLVCPGLDPTHLYKSSVVYGDGSSPFVINAITGSGGVAALKFPSITNAQEWDLPNLGGALTDTIMTLAATQTATNKTFTSPVFNTGVSGTAISTDGTFASPSNTKIPSQQAVKTYVDQSVLGLAAKADVRLATNGALPSNTYSNGTAGVGATLTGTATGVLTVDGVTVALNNRILVKDEATQANNGYYICTTAGAVGVAYVLTRTTDGDTDAELRGSWIFSQEGTANNGQGWLNTNTSAITFGTTAITFGEFSAGAIGAGTGLQKSGNTLSIDSTVVTLTGSQTLTNKSIAASQLTGQVSTAHGGTGQDFSASTGIVSLSSGTASAVATTGTGNVVLASSPTIVTPTVASLINMTHNHQNAAGGGTLDAAAIASGTLSNSRLPHKFAIIEEQQAQNTAGGATAGPNTWNTRVLNTIVVDADSLITALSSNHFQPIAGTFRLWVWSPFISSSTTNTSVWIRLTNNSTTTVILQSNNLFLGAATIGGMATLVTEFTANGSDNYIIEYLVTATRATNGLGLAFNVSGQVERYTRVLLELIG